LISEEHEIPIKDLKIEKNLRLGTWDRLVRTSCGVDAATLVLKNSYFPTCLQYFWALGDLA
jgi:hypothetical protein